jgi:hypothetical protein
MLTAVLRPNRPAAGTAMVMAVLLATPLAGRADVVLVDLTAATIAAWQQYERQVDDRYAKLSAAADPFFVQDLFAKTGWRQQAAAGQITMMQLDSVAPSLAEPSIPDGRVHHWVGAVFVRGWTVERVVNYLRDRAGRESEAFDDVLASKALSRDGDRVKIYMKLRRESVITVTYNTEHAIEYRRLSATRATSRSASTKIAELSDAGTPQEREKPVGSDHGFLWRLNAYWRYEQAGDGVLIECESVSLSRGVPMLLRPFVAGTVERIAKESLQKTLTSLRTELSRAGPPPSRRSASASPAGALAGGGSGPRQAAR